MHGDHGDPRKYRDTLERWLETRRWHAYATFTFADGGVGGRRNASHELVENSVPVGKAKNAIRRTVRGLGEEVYAFVAYERGVAGKRTHLHALLGWPTRQRMSDLNLAALEKKLERRLWRHGRFEVARYEGYGGVVRYLVKQCGEDPDNWEIIGVPIGYKRKRRKRGRRRK